MISDSEVKRNVEHELEWDAGLDATNIGVTVDSGVVTLTGQVKRYNEKLVAEAAAKRVKGVFGVANDIETKLGPDARTDAEVARDAVTALQLQLPVSAQAIKVIVENGHLRLEGEVEWHYQRQQAARAVQGLRGVKGVNNQITLKPAVSSKEVRGNIQAAFHRSAQLEANRVNIETTGSEVELNGTVKTWAEREEAERAAWMAPGVSRVVNNIRINA